ncbi:MAG: cyclic nucleotide-binding domain-containing protein [Spirosomataceae bacterium]
MAYLLAMIAMMGVGKIYEHFEHHLSLSKLVTRVLFAVLVLILVMAIVLWVRHTIAVAIAIMVGFRVVYLLVNLEFWGLSALMFDVRQSKRLFSVIGSGDMPAKAIGAVLTILIHSTSALVYLLLLAFAAFLLAFFTQILTFRHAVIPAHATKTYRKTSSHPKIIQQLFGDSRLVFQMCVSLVAIAAAATWIEYNFFVNVKYKFHFQHDVISFVGILLTITYLISALVKLIFSVRVIERVGLKNALYLLPIATILISVVLVVLSIFSHEDTSLLVYFSAAYLGFEVFRRTVFDAVFLVMFQPLSSKLRLKAHTLAKGFYEPLGMGIAGALLLTAYYVHSSATWFVFGLTALFAALAFHFLRKAYRYYLLELHAALSKRFLRSNELVIKGDALKLIVQNLQSERPEKVINAIDWLEKYQSKTLRKHLLETLSHASSSVRLRALESIRHLRMPIAGNLLWSVAQQDPDPTCRQMAASLACASEDISPNLLGQFLTSSDLATLQGAILGCWQANKNHDFSQTVRSLFLTEKIEEQQTALSLLTVLKLSGFESFIKKLLHHPDLELRTQAIETAGKLDSFELYKELTQLVPLHNIGWKATSSLLHSGHPGFLLLKEFFNHHQDLDTAQKIIWFCEKTNTLESKHLLEKIAQQPNLHLRQLALKSLTINPKKNDHTDGTVFNGLLRDELQHSYQLLQGIEEVKQSELQPQIRFELEQSTTRVFYLLMLLYNRSMVADAMLGVANPEKEKRANALEILDNIIPRLLYRCVEALLDETVTSKKLRAFEEYLTEKPPVIPIANYILQQGEGVFGNWTIATVLRYWTPPVSDFELFASYIQHPVALFREAALYNYKRLITNPTYQHLTLEIPMHVTADSAKVSDMERVIVLKNTQLFSHTPENVLTSIVPIIKEVTFQEGDEIFKKGAIGNCMFIIYSGTVGIYEQATQLVTFSEGDFFGELALLDTEPRSASAVAETDVLLFRIDQEDFYDLMEERSELLRNVLRILCQRIRALNAKVDTLSHR